MDSFVVPTALYTLHTFFYPQFQLRNIRVLSNEELLHSRTAAVQTYWYDYQ